MKRGSNRETVNEGKSARAELTSSYFILVCCLIPVIRVPTFWSLAMSRFFPTPQECGHHTIFGNIPITTLAGEHLQFSLAVIPPGGVVGLHSHVNEQMGLVLSGKAVFTIGGEEKTLQAGDFFRIPGNVPHQVVALDEPVRALDVFYPIRDEYR
jgi:quercetin dioxygenase-like cupin family protein